MIVIRGGEVLTREGWTRADVGIEGSLVTRLGTHLEGDRDIDAGGCLVGPGLVDLHTHLRDPGQTWKEDISSGSAAAAAGGFTAVTAMPNTDPPMDKAKVVEAVLNTARAVDVVDVVPSGALTKGRAGAAPADVEALYRAGVRLFTDDGDSVGDADLLMEVMTRISALPGAFVAQHAEDTAMTSGGHMHEGSVSRRLGVGGMPWEAETEVVQRDLDIAARTGARYHCQHVSARATVEVIRAAKRSGLPVTAEVTPHHLTFDESWLTDLDPDFKMYPPLRAKEDREALIAALADGTIDAVATDHAPHQADEKAVGFTHAPRGVTGLETAAAALWGVVPDRDLLFAALSLEPARILGLADQGRLVESGTTANLAVFDPATTWTAGPFRSRSSNSPFRGRVMKGQVRATIRRGRVTHRSEIR